MIKGLVIKASVLVVMAWGMADVFKYSFTGKSDTLALWHKLQSLSMPKVDVPEIPDIKNKIADLNIGEEPTLAPTEVFKWVDEEGVVHYTSAPPENGHAKRMLVDPNTNVVQATKLPPPPLEKPDSKPATKEPKVPEMISRLKDSVDQAKDVQRIMDERTQQLDEAMNKSK